jgi:hypothetical protein
LQKCEYFTNDRKSEPQYGIPKVKKLKYLGVMIAHSRYETVRSWKQKTLETVKKFAFKLR